MPGPVQGLPSPALGFAGGFFQKLSDIQDQNNKDETKREDAAVARFEEGLKMYNQAKKQGTDNAAKAATFATQLGGDPNDPVVQNAAKMMANQGIDDISYGQELVRQTKIKQAQAKSAPGPAMPPPAAPTTASPASASTPQALPNAGPDQQGQVGSPGMGAQPDDGSDTPPTPAQPATGAAQTPAAIPTTANTQGQTTAPSATPNAAQSVANQPTSGMSGNAGPSAAPPAMSAGATPPIQSGNIKGPTQLPADQSFAAKYILGQTSPAQTAQNVSTRIQSEYGMTPQQVQDVRQGNYPSQKLALDPSVSMASVNPEEVENKQDILKKLVDIRNYSSPALFHKALGLIGDNDLEGAAGLADMTADKINQNKVEIKNVMPPAMQDYYAKRGDYYDAQTDVAELRAKSMSNSVLSDNDINYIKSMAQSGNPDAYKYFKGPMGAANQAKLLKALQDDPNSTPTDLAVADGNFKGYLSGLRTLENRNAPLNVSINELGKFSSQAKAIFQGGKDPYNPNVTYPGLPNGDYSDVNTLMNYAEQHTGSPEQQRLGAALLGVSNAYAVVSGRGKLPTDADKRAARDLLSVNASQQGLPAVLDQMGMEGVMAKQSVVEAKANYNRQFGSWSTAPSGISPVNPPAPPPPGLPHPQTQQEYDALEKGTQYIGRDGKTVIIKNQ